ncbi:MAG: polyphenol oxidase family protein [Candidatus Pacebacteria bacterium]|nr:polyphenol oxidase family protein [Candidatus Paceibacterota bacterium]
MQVLLTTPLINIHASGRNETLESLQASLPSKQIKRMRQKHTANLEFVTTKSPFISEDTDALITNDPNVALAVNAADCLPIIGWHKNGIRFSIHAGRVGTEKDILKKTLIFIKDTIGIKDDLSLWFGPHICKDCYEVDRDNGTTYNLREKNTSQAISVFPDLRNKIFYSEYCTAHHNDQWYSYRKEGKGVSMNWFLISQT